jgi:phosphatidylglycerophosphate synthase
MHRAAAGIGEQRDRPSSTPRLRFVPPPIATTVLRWLERAADWLVAHRVSANAVTSACLALSFLAALLLAGSAFGIATIVMVAASLGDALDGMVARRSHTESPEGALLDASCDRYQEFFLLGGVAIALRDSPLALAAALFAIVGSFMVSYGTAKAEALNAPVPAGEMRRPERAVVLCVGTAITAVCAPIADRVGLARGFGTLPLTLAVLAIAVVANASAVSRLRAIGDSLHDRGEKGTHAPDGPRASR